MKLLNSLILTITASLIIQTATAQIQSVTGKVTDNNGIPLAGVSVRVQSTRKGTITDNTGAFKVLAPSNDVLEFTIIGFSPITLNINGKNELSIIMQPAQTDLSEIVLVGSRRGARIKTETPVPIDVININQVGTPTAKMDLTSVLNAAAPSFNYNKQSGSDGADHIDVGTLRGLAPSRNISIRSTEA